MAQTIFIEDLVSESFEAGADNSELIRKALRNAQQQASQQNPVTVLFRQQITADQLIALQPPSVAGAGKATAWHDVSVGSDIWHPWPDPSRPPGIHQLTESGPDLTWQAQRGRGGWALINCDRCSLFGLQNYGGKPLSTGRSAPPDMWMNPQTQILYATQAEAGPGAVKKRSAREGQFHCSIQGCRDCSIALVSGTGFWGDGFAFGPYGSGTDAIPCERIQVGWIAGDHLGREAIYFTGTKHLHLAAGSFSVYNGTLVHSENGGNKLLDQEDIVIEQLESDGSTPTLLQIKGETAMRGFALRQVHTASKPTILLYAPLRDGEKILTDISIEDLSWDQIAGEIITPWNIDGLSLIRWKGQLSKRVTLIDPKAALSSQPIVQQGMQLARV